MTTRGAARHSRPRISVVTVVRNQRAGIEETLRSVREQRHVAVEHIVIDGGSTDGTLEILRQHQHELACLVSEPDGGIYEAINKGIACCRGEYVGLLHAADTYCDAETLAAVAAAARRTRADVVYGDYIRWERAWGLRLELRGTLDLLRDMSLCHEAMFVSRGAYRRFGLYRTDMRLAADHEFAVRLLRAGATFAHVPQPVAVYGSGGESDRSFLRAYLESATMLWHDAGATAAARYASVQCRRLLARGVVAGIERLLGAEAGRRAVAAYFGIKQHVIPGVRVVGWTPQ
jgi:glycosyltransferase involved in cell wall biosynthesis